jgi:ABC-2 type transport system ATP-binding protein
MAPAIDAQDLAKRFGDTKALDGLTLQVPEGTVLALLGPNGAGKTTTVRILTTLLPPDGGQARVAGYDVVREPDKIRRALGLSGQFAAVDEYLTGRENLILFGQLCHMRKKAAVRRASELIERFDLTEAAGRLVKTYSGGMRRRLDLAGSLVAQPRILFLDEPTTGLDPRSRLGVWEMIGELVSGGVTLLLTTQYLEEADRLADAIAVVDQGRVIAKGTADELKDRIGGSRLEVITRQQSALAETGHILRSVSGEEPLTEERMRRVTVPASGGIALLNRAAAELERSHIEVQDVALRRPTLDDVFMALTGRAAQNAERGKPVEVAQSQGAS